MTYHLLLSSPKIPNLSTFLIEIHQNPNWQFTITSQLSLSLSNLSLPLTFLCQACPSLCNISIINSSKFIPKYLPPPFSCCFSYLISKFYFTCRFESFVHQISFTTDLRFPKWGREIIHSHHPKRQSNCCTNERGRMGKKSRETKSFSLYFAKPVQPYRFPVLWLNRPVFYYLWF